jgi:hypothetical protein
VKKSLALSTAAVVALALASTASAAWDLVGTNVVASSPVQGGGYPVPPGSTRPDPGTCDDQQLNSNHSESWLAVNPGTEDIVGVSKFFIDKWSTFYDFHLGSFTIPGGSPAGNNQVQGYECTTLPGRTQEMPPSWTNNTDPNVDWDTQGRVYQATLPFNAFWEGGLHPNGEIDVSYSDNMGQLWTKANGGRPLDTTNNQTSLSFGHVEDKQWIAVNHFPLSPYRDHVYAMWTTFNGANGNGKIMVSVMRDRNSTTFSRAVQLTTPSETTPGNTYVYPSIGPDGTVYVAFVGGFDLNKNKVGHVYVTKSVDDGRTWGPFVVAASPIENPLGYLPPTNFRDGIIEHFAASPTYPGHLYLTYENYDPVGGHMDVYFTQSTDGGLTWSDPALVNDDAGTAATDQFQPSVAAGPNGAVAVAFYDRRAACTSNASDVSVVQTGKANACIDLSVQAYKDDGTNRVGAVTPVLSNVRASTFAWDPAQPVQKVGGLGQIACYAHRDPCTGVFIGDYFGLAISKGNIYAFSVSTHYPSNVQADNNGGPVYYQQQVLATIPRLGFGTGY